MQAVLRRAHCPVPSNSLMPLCRCVTDAVALRSGMPNHDAFAAGVPACAGHCPTERPHAGYGAICVQDLHGVVGDHSARHPSAASADAPLSFQTRNCFPARAMRRSKFGAQTTFGMLALGAWTSACGRHLAPDWLPVSSGAVFVCCRPSAAASSILPEGMAFRNGRHVV
jgi:hypothetical protein